jgi:Lrp/AsnC family leucine-responsive transcriptional regulator
MDDSWYCVHDRLTRPARYTIANQILAAAAAVHSLRHISIAWHIIAIRVQWVARMSLDRYDRKILDLLQKDGRLTNLELAERIGLSPSPCLRRVRALEKAGIIGGYHARLDAQKLGLTLTALVYISMDRHTPERFSNFESKVRVLPEIQECLLITGQDADYQLKVVVRDMQAYQHLLLDQITRIDGVTGVHSSFVLRRVVDHVRLPLP